MKTKSKTFIVPKSLDQSPKIFGFKISTVIISLGLILSGLILLAKSIIITLAFLALSYANIKLEKQFNESGGFMAYLLSLSSKQGAVRVDCAVEFLINKNKIRNV